MRLTARDGFNRDGLQHGAYQRLKGALSDAEIVTERQCLMTRERKQDRRTEEMRT